MEQIKSTADRRYVYDYIRVISCICVIFFHSVQTEGSNVYENVITAFDTIGLPMFFLLSGVLALNSDKTLNIGKYYLNKFIKIVIPFFIYCELYYCWINQERGFTLSDFKLENIKWAMHLIPLGLRSMITDYQCFHLWFVYSIIGLYIIAPFLKRGLEALSRKELDILCIVALVMMAYTDYLPIFGITPLSENYFAYWIIYFIFGFAITRDYVGEKHYKIIAAIGFVCLAVSFLVSQFCPQYKSQNYHDLSPQQIMVVLGTFSIFMLIEKKLTSNMLINKIISFIASYTFSIYLIHGYFASVIYFIIPENSNLYVWDVEKPMATFVLSFVFALIFDNIITKNVVRLAKLIIYRGIPELASKIHNH